MFRYAAAADAIIFFFLFCMPRCRCACRHFHAVFRHAAMPYAFRRENTLLPLRCCAISPLMLIRFRFAAMPPAIAAITPLLQRRR